MRFWVNWMDDEIVMTADDTRQDEEWEKEGVETRARS
jgi:hypothetical protein